MKPPSKLLIKWGNDDVSLTRHPDEEWWRWCYRGALANDRTLEIRKARWPLNESTVRLFSDPRPVQRVKEPCSADQAAVDLLHVHIAEHPVDRAWARKTRDEHDAVDKRLGALERAMGEFKAKAIG